MSFFNKVVLMGKISTPFSAVAEPGAPGVEFTIEIRGGAPHGPEATTRVLARARGAVAESIIKYMVVGDPILVDGALTHGEDGGLQVEIKKFSFVGRPRIQNVADSVPGTEVSP